MIKKKRLCKKKNKYGFKIDQIIVYMYQFGYVSMCVQVDIHTQNAMSVSFKLNCMKIDNKKSEDDQAIFPRQKCSFFCCSEVQEEFKLNPPILNIYLVISCDYASIYVVTDIVRSVRYYRSLLLTFTD